MPPKLEPLYIQKERERIKDLSNGELLDELLDAVSNEANDMADARDHAYRNLYESVYRERLKNFLSDQQAKVSHAS
jgi:hypothetical protein